MIEKDGIKYYTTSELAKKYNMATQSIDYYRKVKGLKEYLFPESKTIHILESDFLKCKEKPKKKEEILDGIICPQCGKQTKYKDITKFYNHHFKPNHYKLSRKEKVILLKYNNEIPKCEFCGNDCKLHRKINKFEKTCCSRECITKLTEKTKLERYGDKHYTNMDKMKETKLERYGYEYFTNYEKGKKTRLEKYGDENYSNREKIRKTKLEKYGDENYINHEKIKETFRKKYGVDYPLLNKKIMDKTKETMKEKYGVEHGLQLKSIHNQTIETQIKQYLSEMNKKCIEGKIERKEDKYIHICNICKHEDIIETNYYHYRFESNISLCTNCYPMSKGHSFKEKEISQFIRSIYSGEVIENDKSLIKKEIDILIPEKKLGIEFNGIYWHSDEIKPKNYHLNKTEECNKLGYDLIHIFEDDWLSKQEIVKSILRNKLGVSFGRHFARKCEIKEIPTKEANEFLNENHLQGGLRAKSINIGLYHNTLYKDGWRNELVYLLTFGKARFKNSKYEYELYRSCGKLNTNIIGGFAKALKYFVNTYNPQSIITYADRSVFDGSVYKNNGFDFIGYSQPNYFYTQKNSYKRENRFKFRKSELIKENSEFENMTEDEIMKKKGYNKIYNCGNLIYEWNNINGKA